MHLCTIDPILIGGVVKRVEAMSDEKGYSLPEEQIAEM